MRLIEVEDRTALEKECIEQAKALLERHRTVAVVVNRVASASMIAGQLTEALGSDAIVTLLTGRMRPLDRDDVLRELRPAVQTGRERSVDLPRRVIVGTQCIEAGADFDFDALVTEAASLDSLRQRFGRVDRLGHYKKADGVVVYDKTDKDDPVYGEAIAETIRWLKEQQKDRPKKFKEELKHLKEHAKKLTGEAKQQAEDQLARKTQIDFGALALDAPTGDELTKLLAPKPNAPTLLPAYLDLWAQTSPAPSQVPDVSLWLHGPSSGPADVQVIWRADLSKEVLRADDSEEATAIVTSVRPSSLEAISLPFITARAWLAGETTGDVGDTEGAELGEHQEPTNAGRHALRWRGDKSEIVSVTTLKPGDTIIVPVSVRRHPQRMLRRHFDDSRHGPCRAGQSFRTRAAGIATASNGCRWTPCRSPSRRTRRGPRLSRTPRCQWRLASMEAPVGTEARKRAPFVCCVCGPSLDSDRGKASCADRAPKRRPTR